MKKVPSKKLQLGKLKIASLSRANQEIQKGGLKSFPLGGCSTSVCYCTKPVL